MKKNKEEILKEINTNIETLLSLQEGALMTLRKKADDIKLQKLRERILSTKEEKSESNMDS